MRPPQLGPLRKLVLAARRIQLFPTLQVLLLKLALLGDSAREFGREGVEDVPELFFARTSVSRSLPAQGSGWCRV